MGDCVVSVGDVSVSNFGEVFDVGLGVSLSVCDVLSRLDWGVGCKVGVLRLGGEVLEFDFVYCESVDREPLGVLDSVLDCVGGGREVLCARGVTFKPLRLDDVVHYRMLNYMGDEHCHKFRIMVSDIETHSAAYHAKSIRPGDILHTLNGKSIPDNWNDFAAMAAEFDRPELPLHITTESSKIIII